MAEADVIRILNRLDEMQERMNDLKIKLDTHCAVSGEGGSNWKTYMLFTVLGALASQGPTGIAILTKWLGIA